MVNWTASGGSTDGIQSCVQTEHCSANETDGGYATVPNTSSNTYTITGLQAGTQYSVAVYSTSGTFVSTTAPNQLRNYKLQLQINMHLQTSKNASLILGQPTTETSVILKLWRAFGNIYDEPCWKYIYNRPWIQIKRMYVCDRNNKCWYITCQLLITPPTGFLSWSNRFNKQYGRYHCKQTDGPSIALSRRYRYM